MEDSDENCEDVENLNKDQKTRRKIDKFKIQVGKLVKMILGDASYESRSWDKKIKSVKKAMGLLNDQQLVLKRLMSIMENMNISHDVRSPLQELQSFFQQSENVVLNQDCPNEIHGDEVIQMEDLLKELQKEMEESPSFGAELMQIMDMLEPKHQSLRKASVYISVANLLQKVVDSCMEIAQNDILNQDCTHQVEAHHGVKIQGDQIRLSFPQTPDSIQIIEKGENAEVHNQEMIVQDKQGKEVILILRSEGERLAELKLAKKITNQVKGSLEAGSTDDFLLSMLENFPLSKLFDGYCDRNFRNVATVRSSDCDEGTSSAAANEANVKLSSDETCTVKDYKVLKRNANVLTEIFQNNPKTDENFRLAHQDLQSPFMNSLAEVYLKVKKSEETLEPKDIKSMELMIQDMEQNGLQLTWLKEMLAEVELQEKIKRHRAVIEEAQQALSKLKKKPRLN